MRTLLFSVAAAASALAFASPASAQYYPQPQGYAHGYHNPYNHGQIQVFMARIDRLQRTVHQLDRQGRLSRHDAARIHRSAEQLRQRLIQSSFNGLNRRERALFNQRIDRLNALMRHEMRQYRGNDRRWGRDDRWDRDDRRGRDGRRWNDRDDDDEDDRRRRGRDRDDD